MTARIADRPHLVTIAISLLASIIASLALYESHSARRLSIATSRAILRVTAARITSLSRVGIYIDLTTTNLGKSVARNVQLSFSGGTLWGDEKSTDDRRSMDDIVPSTSARAQVVLGVNKYPIDVMPSLGSLGKAKPVGVFVISTDLTYVDEATGAVFKERQCFQGIVWDRRDIISEMLEPCREMPLVPIDEAIRGN
jgi:hypothetical protein